MRRRAVAALVVVALGVGVGGAVLVLRGGDEGVRPPAPDLRTVDPRNLLTIAPTSQYDLAHDGRIRAAVAAGSGMRADVVITAPSGRGAPVLRRSARLRQGGSPASIQVTPSSAERRLISDCRDRIVVVSLVASGGERVARRVTPLPADPPACGRFFSPRSVWNTALPDDAPLSDRSKTYVADLVSQVREGWAKQFPPTLNTTRYSVPIYTVAAGQPRVPVQIVGKRSAYAGRIKRDLAAGVPIPDGARPAQGTDAHMVIWQPATDTMWETFATQHREGRWTASWGGMMRNVSASAGYFADPSGIQPGGTATSLALVGGLITLEDLRRGQIDHALALAIPKSRAGVWARPAQRTDGFIDSQDAIPAGTRFRLDPDVDVDALRLPRITAMIARAAQRYGIYVRDTSPSVTLYGEDPGPTGSNPWTAALQPYAAATLKDFPWARLQATRADLYTWSNKRVAR